MVSAFAVFLLLAAASPEAPEVPGLGARIRALPLAARKGVPEGAGIAVDVVYAEGAAARAGLVAGDVFLGLDGEPVPSPRSLGEALSKRHAGDPVRFTVWRGGKRVEASATLGSGLGELTRSCEKRDAAGCAGLAELYLRGAGVERDGFRAARLFQDACDAGDATSCTTIAFMQLRMVSKPVHPGPAIGLYTRGCDGGDPRGCALLGQAYEVGLAMMPDREKAAGLYRKACDGGAGEGCSGLAGMHLKGEGVEKDAKAALELYRAGCELWDGQGCFSLGSLEADAGASLRAFRKGCDSGHPQACLKTVEMMQEGRGAEADAAGAAAILQRMCEQWGYAPACLPLADVYAEGRGVARDAGRAADLLQRFCDMGDETACGRVRKLREVPPTNAK
jgi:uncharacterized protein